MRVAILGTGKMGGAMARRLKSEGDELTLWNRTRERAEALGVGRVAATPAEAVENAEIVISMLTDADAVRAAYLGDGGAAKAAKNQVFVEMSTAGPAITSEIAPHIEKSGARLVEAPVLGSIGAVEGGKLLILAAGDREAIERARPVLEALGEVRVVGDLGSAASLKLVANIDPSQGRLYRAPLRAGDVRVARRCEGPPACFGSLQEKGCCNAAHRENEGAVREGCGNVG